MKNRKPAPTDQFPLTEDGTVTSARPAPGQRASSPEQSGPTLQIPWNYGKEKLCAMVVDPTQLFLHWEISDEAIAAVRSRFKHTEETWLHLRIYDTTDRLFDGSNAHSYVDHGVQRSDRQWFCQINKPGSSAHAELGLKDVSGGFTPLLRSGRVDFPRRDSTPPGDSQPLEWMTVREDGTSFGHGGSWGSGAPPGGEQQAVNSDNTGGSCSEKQPDSAPHHHSAKSEPTGEHSWSASQQLTTELEAHSTTVKTEQWSWESREFFPDWSGLTAEDFGGSEGTRWTTVRNESVNEVLSWTSMGDGHSWTAGPFAYPVEIVTPSIEEQSGSKQVLREGNAVRVLHGPWQVTIRGLGAHASSQVLSRWSIHRTWTAPASRHSQQLGVRRHKSIRIGASDQRLALTGEWHVLGASEQRLSGSSERHLLGASELRFSGASEQRFLAGSEHRLLGSSENHLGGSSERRLGGSSESTWAGSSESLLRQIGSSENLFRTDPNKPPFTRLQSQESHTDISLSFGEAK